MGCVITPFYRAFLSGRVTTAINPCLIPVLTAIIIIIIIIVIIIIIIIIIIGRNRGMITSEHIKIGSN